MVFESIVHSLWTSILGTVKNVTQDKSVQRKTLNFPQGEEFLDYRENNNLRGASHLIMSSPEMNDTQEKAKYIENVNKKKYILEKTADLSMKRNLENIENFMEKRHLDPDAEYYRRQSNQNRMKQFAEKNMFSCLTCKDTSISEHNSVLFKNMPYVEYTKVQQDESPWELQTMKIKTSPDILRNVNLINNSDRDILKNIFKK